MRSFKTVGDRIRFAVAFANENLELFREGDWLNLREELESFGFAELASGRLWLSTPLQFARGGAVSRVPEPTRTDLVSLQQRVRELLGLLADTHSSSTKGAVPIAGVTLKDEQHWAAIQRSNGEVVLSVRTSFAEAILLRLLWLLSHAGAANLRRCPADDCGRVFWRVRRQLYCSRTCSTRIAMRKFLKKKRAGTSTGRKASRAR